MNLFLSGLVFDLSRSHPISSSDFDKIREANNIRLSALAVEGAFDILVESYFEFEKDCVDIALRMMISFHSGDINDHNYRLLLNRRFMNIMTAARSFQDQLEIKMKEIFHENGKRSPSFSKIKAPIYDSSPQFRALSLLRNHVQHHGLPIQRYSHSSQWDFADGKKSTMKVHLKPMIDIDDLLRDKEFSKRADNGVLSCLSSDPLPLLLAKYVENLWEMQNSYREMVGEKLEQCDEIINGYLELYSDLFKINPCDYISIHEFDGNQESSRLENLFRRLELIRKYLIEKNLSLRSVSRSYVVTKVFND